MEENKKYTGWEIDDLGEALVNEHDGVDDALLTLVKNYPLASINAQKDKLVLIRKHLARIWEGKIDLMNLDGNKENEHYPISHFAMIIISISELGVSGSDVFLPNNLSYEKVILSDTSIEIHCDGNIVYTNVEEIRCLSTIYKFTEEDIQEKFASLTNEIKKEKRVVKSTIPDFTHGDLGSFVLDEHGDYYESAINYKGTQLSLLVENAKHRKVINLIDYFEKRIYPSLELYKKQMVVDLLSLKNDTWLEEDEAKLSSDAFEKQASIVEVRLSKDQSFELLFDVQTIFLGHEVVSSFDKKRTYVKSDLIG